MNFRMKILLAGLILFDFTQLAPAQTALEKGFHNPPENTRPWVYWYWINDNISREGITRDLEAMARVGIGEAFIGNIYLPEEPPGNVPVLSEKWWQMIEHAIREGHRLGVNVGMFNCPGWSQSGGPWIKPDQAMRYVTTGEIRLKGPQKFTGRLPQPKQQFQQIAVLAFPTPKMDDTIVSTQSPQITCQPEIKNVLLMFDNNFDSDCVFPEKADHKKPYTINIKLAEPFTARSLSLHPGRTTCSARCLLQAKNEEGQFVTVKNFIYNRIDKKPNVGPMINGPVTVSFPAVTAQHFRLQLKDVTGRPSLAEINLSAAARLQSYVEKQLGKMSQTPYIAWDSYRWPKSPEPDNNNLVVGPDTIRNITKHVSSDGRLRWNVPEGEWIILRTGMTPTGTENSPSAPHGRGLEVDKMNPAAVQNHFNAFIGKLLKRMPADQRQAFHRVVADSYETGSENWTEGFDDDFRETYGYDPLPWLPVFTGRIVGTTEQSDRFLWDLRRLVADKIATGYVAAMREMCHRNNLELWLENYGHWGFPGEFLQYGGQTDRISGEFWRTGQLGNIECRDAASAAHIYGKPVVYAEAFTAGGPLWEAHPWTFKARGDWAFTEGINHFVLHVYIHQPQDKWLPGINAWFGTEFNRHNTWFDHATDWIDYLRRCHYLLQEGTNVADVCYFIGEDAPKMTGPTKPELPAGYAFDYINAEVIRERLIVKDGRFVLPCGTSYKLMILPEEENIRPELLKNIHELVKQGGAILGSPPQQSPSLKNYPACDQQVRKIAAELWNECDGKNNKSDTVGRGHVFRNISIRQALDQLQLPPDLDGLNPPDQLWIHRSTPDADIYFISNQKDQNIAIDPVFRTQLKAPELWHPDTGRIETLACFAKTNHGVRVPLQLKPRESVFVVFRETPNFTPVKTVRFNQKQILQADYKSAPHAIKKLSPIQVAIKGNTFTVSADHKGTAELTLADGQTITAQIPAAPQPVKLAGPWQVFFNPRWRAPEKITFEKLISWTEHPDPAIKYYSGTATYQKSFNIPAEFLADNQRVLLDLGQVQVMAGINLNGHDLPVLWKPPFCEDVTDLLQKGENTLQVKVVNVWRNRLAGDEKITDDSLPWKKSPAGRYLEHWPEWYLENKQRPSDRQTLVTIEYTHRNKNPLPAGLLGPVTLKVQSEVHCPGK